MTFTIRRPILSIITKDDVDYNAGLTQLKEALEEARHRHPETRLWDLLFDVTESTENRSEDELRGIAMALAQHSHMLTGRMAVVAADPSRHSQGEVFGVFAEQLGKAPRVFSRRRDAEAWLRSPDDSN
jgi:hypothetical protein